jgi:hypothetical protein
LTMTKWQAVPNQPKALDMLLLSNSKSWMRKEWKWDVDNVNILLTYLWTLEIFEVNVLTTYVKLERKWLWLGIKICYVVLFPFAPISMPCRYSLNKKQRKKGKKAKPVRYISTCVQTEKLFGNFTMILV